MGIKIINTDFRADVDYTYSLMKSGKYEEARTYMTEKMPVFPSHQNAEALWVLAQCEYYLGEYGVAQSTLITIINMPLSGTTFKKNEIRSFQNKARELQTKIKQELSSKALAVVFPDSPFREFLEKSDGASNTGVRTIKQGVSAKIGDYYVKYSIGSKEGEEVCNIYVKPVNKTSVDVFVYLDAVNKYFQTTDDDMIVNLVLSKKYPTLAKMINAGKEGPANECRIFRTKDYAQPPLKDYPPVLGCRAAVQDCDHVSLDELESTMEIIVNHYEKLSSEVISNPPSNGDTAAIALLAILKGVAGKAFGQEFWPEIKESLISALK